MRRRKLRRNSQRARYDRLKAADKLSSRVCNAFKQTHSKQFNLFFLSLSGGGFANTINLNLLLYVLLQPTPSARPRSMWVGPGTKTNHNLKRVFAASLLTPMCLERNARLSPGEIISPLLFV